jgi:bifunctional DNA-binding transcriptional regulator/antitoxin component of YhaV-PrlF toxin-antitoxin module
MLPLTEHVNFKARMNCRNRFQVPKNVRWRFRLETNQILKVQVSIEGAWGQPQAFFSRLTKDGRIVIPKITMRLLNINRTNLTGYILDVTLTPT